MKNFKWDKKYLYWGVTAFCVVVASILFFWLLNTWNGLRATVGTILSVLSPVIYGLLIAYILNRVLVLFEERVFKKLCSRIFKDPVKARKAARIFSILVTLLLALGFIAGLLVIILPEIANSITNIISNSEEYLNVALNWLQNSLQGSRLEEIAAEWINSISDKLVDWLQYNVLPRISDLVTSITGGVISVVMTIVDLFIGIIVSVYLMYNKETFCAQAKKVLYCVLRPRPANAVMRELDYINEAFGNYIVGTLIDALIVGILNYVFMMAMGMPYAALATIIVAVTNIIPVFGPFIGAVPSTLLILLENPTQALIFVIFTVVLQQIDGQILKPRIHASRSGLSGFWIMFAILFFGGLFGIGGMVVGVPMTTVLYNIARRGVARHLRARGLPTETEKYVDMASVDPATGELRPRPSPAPSEKGSRRLRKKRPAAPENAPEQKNSPEQEKK